MTSTSHPKRTPTPIARERANLITLATDAGTVGVCSCLKTRARPWPTWARYTCSGTLVFLALYFFSRHHLRLLIPEAFTMRSPESVL
ncbi:uncharacterized protein isoform X2 [Rhodnius prolixus]|uniref:uncharacterized protein isoform X2 n=1 Tax=Rhodnius prolixus TaxID=13249 RepID=UPI003D18F8B1